MDASPQNRESAGLHTGLGLLFLTLGLLLFLGLDSLSRKASLSTWIQRPFRENARAEKRLYSNTHYFADTEDNLLLDELRRTDHSKGGIFFFGSSNTKWATRFENLPRGRREFFHNYGIGACHPAFQLQLLKFVLEGKGLAKADPAKTVLLLGVSYHNVAHETGTNAFFVQLWHRHPIYSYDERAGISMVPINPLSGGLYIKTIRIAGFIQAFRERLLLKLKRPRIAMVRAQDPNAFTAEWSKAMGPNWKTNISDGLEAYARLLDYARDHQIETRLVLLPLGSWEQSLPFAADFNARMTSLAAVKNIPLLDWSHLLSDAEFADSVHPNPDGVDKIQTAILQLTFPQPF